jgi:hypothetical protein
MQGDEGTTTTDTSTTTTGEAGTTTTQAATTTATPSGDQATQQDTATTEADAGNGEGGDTATAAAPEAYSFTMPEGMELDTAAVERYAPVFQELGLTQEQAQRLVDLRAAEVKAMQDGAGESAEKWYAERRAAEIAEANESGEAAIKADKEIGGANFDPVRSRVIEAVGSIGTPELRAEFDRLGLGNNPELVRFVNRLIDYRPQDRGEGGSTVTGGDLPFAQRWARGATQMRGEPPAK